MPWTISKASSSSSVPACSGAWRCATAGQMTMSPRSNGISDGSAGARSGPRVAPVATTVRSISAASMGNGNTSVGPDLPRNDSFSSAISFSPTKISDSSVPPRIPSASSTRSASACQRARSTGTCDCSSEQNTSGSTSPPILDLPPIRGRELSPTAALVAPVAVRPRRFGRGGRPLVGGDDVGNDLVSHDVAGAEVDEAQSFDATQGALQPGESAAAVGDVDLCRVTGDDDLRAEADPGEEHLHLL